MAVIYISQVCGNLLNYGIFYGGNIPNLNGYGNDSTSASPTVRDLSICGRNDCQDPNVTDQNISRYEASQLLTYILIGTAASFVVIAMLMQTFIIKEIDKGKEIQDSSIEFECEGDKKLQVNKQNSLFNKYCSVVNARVHRLTRISKHRICSKYHKRQR